MKVSKESKFTDEFLRGVYTRNSDGIGVMWSEDNKLHFRKLLPKTVTEAIAFFRANAENKDCCVHWRMKTHGHIDYENCHPYPVFGFDNEHHHPMLLMHNGVLSSGNSKDLTKSDTWHFIRDTLRPLLADFPDIVFNEVFIALLGKHIGNNRFAIMDHTGKCAIINKGQGVEYEGSWLSNTYAWDYYGLHPNAPKQQSYLYGKYGGYYGSGAAWKGTANNDAGYAAKEAGGSTAGKQQKKGKRRSSSTQRTKPTTSSSTNVVPFVGSVAYQQTLGEEVQEFADMLSSANADVFEKVTMMQIRRLLVDSKNIHDPWDLLEMFEFGQIDDKVFITCMEDPRKVPETLKRVHDVWTVGMSDEERALLGLTG